MASNHFGRRHYLAIAKVMGTLMAHADDEKHEGILSEVEDAFIVMFKADRPDFDTARFVNERSKHDGS